MSEDAATVLSPVSCHLGEGPTYDPASDTLWWFDIVEKKLLEQRLSGGETRIHELPFMASALAAVDDKRQLVVAENGLHIRDIASGSLTLYRALEADNPVTRSNDARVHPCGAFWIGTMGKNAERGAGAVYWLFRGEIRPLFPEITIPNSICFSTDGASACFADTRKNLLWRVDCDPATGLPKGEPKILLDHRGKPGGIDGSVMDAEGVIWNARWGAGSLDAYAPDGRHIRSVAVPARQPSCPAFVGADAGRIAVTSAWQGLDEAARTADPQAGQTFLLPIEVKGRFEPRVLL
jgi:sugar lactone lactonase YvrE